MRSASCGRSTPQAYEDALTQDQHQARPVVRHSRESQVVPEPGRLEDRRGNPGIAEYEISRTHGGPRRHHAQVPRSRTGGRRREGRRRRTLAAFSRYGRREWRPHADRLRTADTLQISRALAVPKRSVVPSTQGFCDASRNTTLLRVARHGRAVRLTITAIVHAAAEQSAIYLADEKSAAAPFPPSSPQPPIAAPQSPRNANPVPGTPSSKGSETL